MSKKQAVEVANGRLVKVAVRIRGITPLFMDGLSLEALEMIRLKTKTPKTDEMRTPREEATSRLHLLADGTPHITPYLWAALVNAGRFIRYDGKRQISTATASVLGGLLSIEEPVIPLMSGSNGHVATWEPEMRGARSDSGVVVKILPRFDDWGASFTFRINGQMVHPQRIRDLVDMAGSFIGLGPLRPQKKGFFGKFNVDKWEEIA